MDLHRRGNRIVDLGSLQFNVAPYPAETRRQRQRRPCLDGCRAIAQTPLRTGPLARDVH